MDEAELAQRRTQMGHGIACLADADMEAAVGEGRWRVLTGAPSPDMNMALLHRDQPATSPRCSSGSPTSGARR